MLLDLYFVCFLLFALKREKRSRSTHTCAMIATPHISVCVCVTVSVNHFNCYCSVLLLHLLLLLSIMFCYFSIHIFFKLYATHSICSMGVGRPFIKSERESARASKRERLELLKVNYLCLYCLHVVFVQLFRCSCCCFCCCFCLFLFCFDFFPCEKKDPKKKRKPKPSGSQFQSFDSLDSRIYTCVSCTVNLAEMGHICCRDFQTYITL